MTTVEDRQHWARVESLFHAAADLPRDERGALLSRECGADTVLRAEVEGLLVRHDSPAPGWDDTPTGPASWPAPPALGPGRRVGRYRIIRMIGAGGMGAVYEAAQDTPARTVALKLLAGAMMTPDRARRFEHEALLLGRLRHPGIAQVYDAGVVAPEGRDEEAVPFIAMELVPDARPLARYAHEKGLDTRARLGLFVRVCDAVQHAHTKGVIHRDLKPANILVDSAGNPQIIDFGVARTLGDRAGATMLTGAHTLVGTVAYMSPEQCDPSGDADVRTDVYSLGVVLYELLCGALPYKVDTVTLAEATRIIREQPPRRMSAVRPVLRGDLETITLKALEKERERRYQSVTDLAEDLRCCLGHRPIAARPPSPLYLARRFARRNRILVGAATAVGLTLIAGATVSIAFALHAREEARRAERVNEFLLGALGSANPMVPAAVTAALISPEYEPFADWRQSPWPFAGEPGRAAAAADILRAAGRRLDTDFADDPLAQGRLADALGVTLFRLREPEDAQRLLRLAERVRAATLGPDHEETLRSRLHLAELLDNVDIDESERIYRAALGTCRRRYGPREARTLRVERMLANNLFYHHARQAESLDMLAATVAAGGGAPAMLEHAAYASVLNVDAGRLAEAERLARFASEGLIATVGRTDIRTADALDTLSYALWLRPGAADEAERCAREALAVKSVVFGAGAMQTTICRLRLANGLMGAGLFAKAAEEFMIGLAACERLLGEDDFETLRARGWAARALVQEGTRLADARRLALSAADGLQRRFGPSDTYPLASRATAADALAAMGDKPGAAREWDDIARDARNIQRPDLRWYSALLLARSAGALAAAGQVPEARVRVREAIDLDPAGRSAFRAMLERVGADPDDPR